MASNNKHKKVIDQAQSRADKIAEMMDKFEELVNNHSINLTRRVIETFMDSLTAENGIILKDEENLRKVALVDKAWKNFSNQEGYNISTQFITDINTINQENLKYYRSLSDAQIKASDIHNIVNAKLGIDDKGNLINGGYLKGLIEDTVVRNEIKKLVYNKIISGTGFKDLSSTLKNFIQGNENTAGALNQYYRNFAFDTYAQVDRLNGTLFAEKLNLKYFIFQGTRRAGSRYFCLQNKGKVFSTDEAKEWVNLIGKVITVPGKKEGTKKTVPIGPIIDGTSVTKATYNPVVDMGGIGCVDIASFISEEIAFQLRPDLKTRIKVSEDYKQEYEGKNKAKVYVHNDADKKDLKTNMSLAQTLADNGIAVKIRKHVYSKGIKNPEIELVGNRLGDFKVIDKDSSLKNAVNNAIKNTAKQGGVIAAIKIPGKLYNRQELITAINGALSPKRNKSIDGVIVIYGKVAIEISRDEITERSYYSKLP